MQSHRTIGSILTSAVLVMGQMGCTATTPLPGDAGGQLAPDAGHATEVPPAATPEAVTVSPASGTMGPGETMQYAATLTWSDGSATDVTSLGVWSTSDPSVATITTGGLATGVQAGQATISISAYGFSFSTVVTVSEATARSLSVSPAAIVLPVSGAERLTVLAAMSDGSTRDVTAHSSYQVVSGSIAEVSSGGVVFGRAPGVTTALVHYGAASAEVSVRVSDAALVALSIAPSTLSLNLSESRSLVVTGQYADGSSRDVTAQSSFSVSDRSVASVDAVGHVKGLAAGQVVVTAASGGQFAIANVTVSAPRIVSLTVSPANSTVVKADEAQFTATATYSNGQTGTVTGGASWSVDDTSVGVIDGGGKFTAITVGATEVRATIGGQSNYTTVTVVAPSITAVSVSPSSATVMVGNTVQLSAGARMSNGTSRDVTRDCQWTSGSLATATVAGGLVSGLAEGATYVTCSLEGRTAQSLVTVQAGAPTANCFDGLKNGTEADVDCGSACAAKCAMGRSCSVVSDCSTSACFGGVCQGSWGIPTLIETENLGNAENQQLAIDGSGNAVVVWQQSDGTRFNIWSNRYTPGGGWGAATLIESDNLGSAQNPHLATDGSGNTVVVWHQSDGIRDNIWSNRYTPGGGWGAATLIESDNVGHAYYPRVAIDAAGNAIAVWYQGDGANDSIYSNRYTPGGGWGAATLIESDNAGHAYSPNVAIDGAGNAVAVWFQSDGARYDIWANRYTPGGGWGAPTLLENDNAGPAENPQVAVDAAGNAVAVWHQSDGARYDIWANRYTPGGGWGTATLLESDNAGDAYFPQVAVDAAGNAVAVWMQFDGANYNVWSNRYTAGGGWGTATLLESDNTGGANYPQAAVNASGNAVAVWYQHDGARLNMWANSYR